MKRRFLLIIFAAVASVGHRATAQIPQSEYQARRAAVMSQLPDGVFLALGAAEPARDYILFFQSADFNYLTGFLEPDAVLMMVKQGGQVRATTLFVHPRDPATETWSGIRLGPDGARARTGMDARPVPHVRHVLDSLARLRLAFHVVGEFPPAQPGEERARTPDEQFLQAFRQRHPAVPVTVVNQVVAQLRARKSPTELALIRRAVDITVEAHQEALRAMRPGVWEYEIQALVEYTFRRRGADRPAFASIIGSGPNSTILHYNRNDRQIQDGDVVVMDIGASYQGYAADVTRTLPANGTFSPAQREIYQIVRDAQAAAERHAVIGGLAQTMSDSASAVLAAGLARLGLIESPQATFECGPGQRCPQLMLYYMHGLGHGIGLEVHDPEQYYFTQRIDVGSAFSIEPGIYVRPNTLEIIPATPANQALIAHIRPAFERYRNIGVRIEDDYLVTEAGVEWVSRAPREIAEIEAAMRAARSP